ncbi:hypothetical protein THAOC_36852 [Thalassiosira oceanica]|uniref:Uncharacterized protein n=1 Tax=Thalassiosira oceanica TaxID=159749 RepID=K0QZI0_THAOC|nr:hypothetical protein THAOC_36852 [Thalassiosira oceanica]|eukprot:EJK44595.1 hypothetical protein THAOC_36852 [Thalassiosira oceanica]
MHNTRDDDDVNATQLFNHISTCALKLMGKLFVDKSNFKTIQKKPSSIYKIAVDGSELLYQQFIHICHGTIVEKYIQHLNEISTVDMSPFMEYEVGLIPHIISAVGNATETRRQVVTARHRLTALYIVYSTKMFRNRIEAASSMVELQSANENLQNEVERLRKQLAGSKLGQSKSIASRVKARKRRK